MPEKNDEGLVKLSKTGDEGAILELWQRFSRIVSVRAAAYAREYPGGFDAEDLRQEAFFGLLAAVRTFRPELGFKFSTHFRQYLRLSFQIAARRRTEKQRRDPLNAAISLDVPLPGTDGGEIDLADVLPDPGELPEDSSERDCAFDGLRRALDSLPEKERRTVWLRFGHGLTREETARRTGLSLPMVKKYEERGMRLLRHPSRRMEDFL